jgi:hypothetical protein
MIPGVMVDFLARASVAIAGTRDASNVPRVRWLTGWAVDDDRASVTCLVPQAFTGGLVRALRDNGRIALVAEVIGPHECYQFKGTWLDSRAIVDGDRRVHEACRQRFVDAVTRHTAGRFTEHALRLRFPEPALAVRFRVEEIFVQTPGPGAGGRLYPPERG